MQQWISFTEAFPIIKLSEIVYTKLLIVPKITKYRLDIFFSGVVSSKTWPFVSQSLVQVINY